MTWSARTALVLFAVILLLGVWEAIVLHENEPGDTISEVIQGAVYRWPVVALLIGILVGHFVWPVTRPPAVQQQSQKAR